MSGRQQQSSLCKYKDVFGKPNEGFHQYQAIGDWVLTLVLALVFSGITYGIYNAVDGRKTDEFPFIFITFLWFVFFVLLAVILHLIFCVDTRVIKFFRK